MTIVDLAPDRVAADVVSVPVQRVRRRIRVGLILASGWILLLSFVAITAQWLPIKKFDEAFKLGLYQSPRFSFNEPFGGDNLGRSVFSRVVYGGRVTLAVGVLSMLMALAIGGSLGLFAGYVGGKMETLLTTLTDAMLAFPPIVFLLTLRSVLVNPDEGRQFTIPKLVMILGLLSIPTFYRQTRAQTMARRDKGYILSAEALGARRMWILFRELAPNVVLPVASIGFIVMAGLMIAEGSLSLLGFGMPEPQPSWGKMIAEGKQNLQVGEHLHVMIIPMLVLFFTVFAFNVVGEAARKKFDSRASRL